MKEKIKKFIFEDEGQLESKWWHRLVKVFIQILTIFVFVVTFAGLIDSENILVTIFGSLFFLLITYLILNAIYYRIILYIVYGKNEYSQIWSTKKIGIFILVIVLLFGLTDAIEKINITEEKNLFEKKLFEIGREIEIESINIQDLGNKYCRFMSARGDCIEEMTTEGKFIEIEVKLKNISKSPISLRWRLREVIDSKEREYYDRTYYGFSTELYEESNIAPGFSDSRKEIYEIPADSEVIKVNIISNDFENQLFEI